MAFVLKKAASYKWEVKVEVPVDGNQFETQAFEAVFKRISRSVFNNLVDKGDDALVDEILLGWEGVNDDAGKPIPFTEKNKQQLCDDPYVLRALIGAYAESFTGASAKN